MNRRNEERYSLLLMAKITILAQPETERDYLLSEVSATGMKLVGPQGLPVGALIGVEFDHHLLLAEVRYSHPRGAHSIAGAMHLRVAPKSGFDPGLTRIERFTQMAEAFHAEGEQASAVNLAELFPSLIQPQNAPVFVETADLLQPLYEAYREQLLFEHATVPELSALRDRPESVAIIDEELGEIEFALDGGNAPEPIISEEEPISNEVEPALIAEPAPEPDLPIQVEDASRRKGWFIPVLAGFVAVAAAGGWMYTRNMLVVGAAQSLPPAASAPALPAEVHPVEAAPAASPVEVTPAAAVIPPAAPVPSRAASSEPTLSHVTFKVSAENWISACQDGKPVFVRLMASGEEAAFDFKERMVIRTGNAGSAHIDVDGKYVGEVGPSGGVRLFELTKSGFRLLNSRSTARDCDAR